MLLHNVIEHEKNAKQGQNLTLETICLKLNV